MTVKTSARLLLASSAWLLSSVSFAPFPARAEEAREAPKRNSDVPPYYVRPAELDFYVERVQWANGKMADGIERMGLLGGSWNLKFAYDLYAGLGTMAALTGDRGGFIGFGVHAGWKPTLFGFYLKPDLFFAAVGGVGVPAGGGLVVRPSASAGYEYKGYGLGAGMSFFHTPTGTIHSSQPFVQATLPTDVLYSDYVKQGTISHWTKNAKNEDLWSIRAWRIAPSLRFYLARGDEDPVVRDPKTHVITHKSTSKSIGLAGISIDHFFLEQAFMNLALYGAFSGAPGYMSLTFGGGYSFPVTKGFALAPKLNVGASGGFGIDTGGGAVLEPSVDAEIRAGEFTTVKAGYGYLYALGGAYIAPMITGALSINMNAVEPKERPESFKILDGDTAFLVHHWRFSFSSQRYFTEGQANKEGNATLENIDLLGLNLNYMLTDNFFIEGSTFWPYSGHATGYAAALLGVGLRYPVYGPVAAEARVGVGPGAGGGLPAGEGMLYAWTIGADAVLTDRIGLFANYGVLHWVSGGITPTAELGVRFLFGTPTKRFLKLI